MSEKRRNRIRVLTDWWAAEIPNLLSKRMRDPFMYLNGAGRPQDYDHATYNAMHRLISIEAKRRWAVSESTARDYADVVFGSTEKALTTEAKKRGLTKRRAGVSLASAFLRDTGYMTTAPDSNLG